MMSVFIVKVKADVKDPLKIENILKRAQSSYEQNLQETYYCEKKDAGKLYKYGKKCTREGYILLVEYKGKGKIDIDNISETEIETIYIGEAALVPAKEKGESDISYEMKKRIKSKSMIINLLDGIDLNFADDFDSKSYVMISEMKSLYISVRDLLIQPLECETRTGYRELNETYELSEFAQHNNMCRRMYGILDEDENRSEFQRDRERIVNSKAFRRLVDKAQIFSADKGEHYRTRMTHTLEVNQIAKAISICLKLNLDLTEAIALAHDLGHTPFGHQGERTIKNILNNEELVGLFNITDSENNWKDEIGGFKHNFQGIRVLTKLEEKYVEYPGLDISFQVLEGVLKHTKIKDACINEFISQDFVDELYMNYSFCTNLEGQVIFIADEIAQRGHDIDDAITSGLINIDELLNSLSAYKFQDLYGLLLEERNNIYSYKRQYINEKDLIIGRIISCIVGYFVADVVKESTNNIKNYDTNNRKGFFDKQLINFTERGKICSDFLEKIVNKRVISNSEVSRFDYNAGNIIKRLFETYYRNPKLLHSGTLRKIYVDTLQNKNPLVANSAVDLSNGNIEVIRNEIKIITTKKISDINEKESRVIFEKRKILIRNIADYISGMTDTYAIKEYNRFFV
ncbi:MAG: dNTP triphosphohydrolase [Clostridium sp.]|nr:dNTP triphosphohydrolase [Clostridium sp.]MCM1534673.1 dNTP triphosphohydrolase [Clostridium sp.]